MLWQDKHLHISITQWLLRILDLQITPTTAEHTVINSLYTVQTTKQSSALVVSWEKPPNVWLTAAKNVFVSRLLNLQITDKGIVVCFEEKPLKHIHFLWQVIPILLTAPFNNMQTQKFKAQPTNAFFATVNQMFGGSSQLPLLPSVWLSNRCAQFRQRSSARQLS